MGLLGVNMIWQRQKFECSEGFFIHIFLLPVSFILMALLPFKLLKLKFKSKPINVFSNAHVIHIGTFFNCGIHHYQNHEYFELENQISM